MIPTRMNPMGWQPYGRKLSYLESTGTQYIDTRYMIPDHGSGSIYIDFGTPNELNEIVYYFGAYYYGGAATVFAQSYAQNKPYQVIMGRWNGDDTKSHSGVLGARDHLKIDYQYGSEANTWSVTWSDGTTSTDTTDRTYRGSNLLLFKVQNVTSSSVPIKIYGFKVWENGSAVRDMIPVLDKSGVPCMYDAVTEKLFYNAGTGTFNYA